MIRKNRNLSEKKRRDQFNTLINELCSMVHFDSNGQIVMEPQVSNSINNSTNPSPNGGSSTGTGSRRMDKSSVLQSTINFLKSHCESISTNGRGVSPNTNTNPKLGTKESFATDAWKPASLSYEEFAQLMLEVSFQNILTFFRIF